MNKESYNQKVNDLSGNVTKFKRLSKYSTDKIKVCLNSLIACVNNKVYSVKLRKITGHYASGYIYGNHKNTEDLSMRPIISQVGIVTYDIAKKFNKIINKYLPKQHMTETIFEFIEISKIIQSPKLLASLEVETNLFENVPVKETININLENTCITITNSYLLIFLETH